jgi:hypothetical protein
MPLPAHCLHYRPLPHLFWRGRRGLTSSRTASGGRPCFKTRIFNLIRFRRKIDQPSGFRTYENARVSDIPREGHKPTLRLGQARAHNVPQSCLSRPTMERCDHGDKKLSKHRVWRCGTFNLDRTQKRMTIIFSTLPRSCRRLHPHHPPQQLPNHSQSRDLRPA